jgi:class 3 adenylate cyclase/tetratricopeptide (TPR) repeat protein
MSASIEQLVPYLPTLVLERLALHDSATLGPESETLPAAVLFADITGFTPLAEALGQQGPAGAEELARLLDACFGRLTSLVSAHGGDVLRLAGDALVALWTPGPEGEQLSALTRRAASCALHIRDSVSADAVWSGRQLSLRIGVGAGDAIAMHVGGVRDRWELLLAGDPFSQMSLAEHQAQPGDVVLSPEAWSLVREAGTGTELEHGTVRLQSITDAAPVRSLARAHPDPARARTLESYLPMALRTRLAAGHTGWLAELRQVSVIFVGFDGLETGGPAALDRIHHAVRALQSALYRYEGSVLKLGVDDKGVTLVAAMGLPPLAHEDDAVRAVEAAQAIRRSLQTLGVRTAIGIASGRVFCGEVGGQERREYTVLGDVPNVAARLMQAAVDDIYCDSATSQAAQSRLTFEVLRPILVKGKLAPVAVYRPGGRARSARDVRPIFGRSAERARLVEQLEAVQGGSGRIVVIEGEPGIGKSRLVADLVDESRSRGLTCLIGAGDAVERSTPYHAWRPVFERILGLEGLEEPEVRRTQVGLRLQLQPDLLPLAPLLNGVVPLDLPDTERTEPMTGQLRADSTRELLLSLMLAIVDAGPLVLVIEDAHWLDSASWALVVLVTRRVRPALHVVVTRPMIDPLPPDYERVLQEPDAQRIRLEALAPESTLALVSQRLGVGKVPAPVAELIVHKAQGNPFFVEELAFSLRDARLVTVQDGECALAPGVDLASISFPDTVQGVIIDRIDRLSPSQQLTLKVASVIGRVFAFRVLQDIYPIEPERPQLLDHVGTLERMEFTPRELSEPDLAYFFKHVITQEVAYNLMLYSQRRDLHRSIAEWFERTYSEDLAPYYASLAHHWGQAQVESKVLTYLEKAGERALNTGAYQEAVDCLTRVLEGGAQLPAGQRGDEERLASARRERWIGEAYLGMGRLKETRDHFERAVALSGHYVPKTPVQLIASAIAQVLMQLVHRLARGRCVVRSRSKAALLLEVARSYRGLLYIHYFANDNLPLVEGCLRMLNVAESAGPSIELAEAFSTFGFIAGVVPLHWVAEAYLRHARVTAETIQNPVAAGWASMTSGFYSTGCGYWERAREGLADGARVMASMGDRRRWIDCVTVAGQAAHYQGEFLERLRCGIEVYALARQSDNVQGQAWGLLDQAESLIALGRTEEADRLLAEAVELLKGADSRVDSIFAYGLLARARLHLGQEDAAREAADFAADLIAQVSPTGMYMLEAYAGVAEVYLALWESGRASAVGVPEVANRARRACAAVRRFAGVFPIGAPRAALWTGLADWLSGKRARALREWHSALHSAERLRMPYECGLAHYELGRHLEIGDPERRERLQRAAEIFERLGAAYDLERVRRLADLDHALAAEKKVAT